MPICTLSTVQCIYLSLSLLPLGHRLAGLAGQYNLHSVLENILLGMKPYLGEEESRPLFKILVSGLSREPFP